MDIDIKDPKIIIGLVAVGFIAFYFLKKNAANVGAAAGGAAVDLAVGAVTGVVEGIGEAVGIPMTNKTECEKAKESGSAWDASFACPAGEFLSYVWNR